MFFGYQRRSKRSGRSAIAGAVVPLMDALEARQLLSAENPVVPPPRLEPTLETGHYQVPAGADVNTGGVDIGSGATLYGTAGDDRIIVEPGPNLGEISVRGIAGIQDGTIIAGVADLWIHTGAGNDSVYVDPGVSLPAHISGGDGDDTLMGGSGDDHFSPDRGNDVYDGAGGFDTFKIDGMLTAMGAYAVPEQGLVPNDGWGTSDTLANIERVLVASPNQSIPDDASEATGGLRIMQNELLIWGTPGDDRITVQPGAYPDEVIVFGVRGVPDGAVYSGIEYLFIKLGDGDDVLLVETTIDVSIIHAGTGDDQVVITGKVAVVHGEAGDDQIVVTGKAGLLQGGPGNDTIRGGEGQDYLDGGPGNDSLDGGGGGDVLFAGIPDAVSGLVVRFDKGTVPSDGYGGHDLIANIEHFKGGTPFADVIWGDNRDNTFLVGGGDDSIFGGGGNDTFYVESPAHLMGGAGDDVYHTLKPYAGLIDDTQGSNTIHFDGFGLPGPGNWFPSEVSEARDNASGIGVAPVRPMAAAQRAKISKLKKLKAAKAKAAKLKLAKLKAAKLKAMKLAERSTAAEERQAIGGRGY